ncbi:hypothetical protein [Mesorhizobium sp. GbtcB19]|uniref:hypothetical protein n=1 Tax=Mesorhizobium sp. GbtcB19 TaxID=2824764 RepID=UPI001C3101C6|nr:hypothetical protein [Mesorhizobium sp. GbtcB19]
MEICDTITKRLDETWTETVESFVDQVDEVCEDLPWPLDWFCHAVVTVVRVVTTIVHQVVRVWVVVVCYTVSLFAALGSQIVNTLLAIPVIGTWVKTIIGATIWAWSQFVGLLDAGLSLIGIRPLKNLRLHVIILMRPDRSLTVQPDDIQLALQRTEQIFRDKADIKVTTTVHLVHGPSVKNALVVDTGVGLFAEDMGDAGIYFQTTIADLLYEHNLPLLIGIGAPIVAFIVDGVGDTETGCSAGPLASYVCVQGGMMVVFPQLDPVTADFKQYKNATVQLASNTLAHELGHACGLAHDGVFVGDADRTNLMYPAWENRGDNLSPFQRAIVRSSPHVTYI